MRIIVIDGQGGNIGKQLVKNIRDEFPDVYIRAIGTNSTATANMLKGGANEAATGENALIVACRDADLIIGPIGIAVADSLLGEVSARMAAAVGQSSAKKILIPLNKCDILIPGLRDKSTSEVLADALNMIRAIMEGKL
ncbi:MAG: DUF3842 family protein [Erysipelotrichaceae bacterium]|jgi:hypothetical protein|nr:DUF3842 family protein [Erysipelotrichaceae bacterium]MBQ1812104.1 DUF3842 family protein [Erysipelotrichaceae bacterium]MBQ5552369.1 DUF3842 family protein [Erysipelotrichaceae bacterium]MBQ5554897.1 DUF3842 family protein [Erysipelotrichaceae bacterium]